MKKKKTDHKYKSLYFEASWNIMSKIQEPLRSCGRSVLLPIRLYVSAGHALASEPCVCDTHIANSTISPPKNPIQDAAQRN